MSEARQKNTFDVCQVYLLQKDAIISLNYLKFVRDCCRIDLLFLLLVCLLVYCVGGISQQHEVDLPGSSVYSVSSV